MEQSYGRLPVSHENNDPHWKELADYLRKLNIEFYWRSQNLISEKKARNIEPPSKPVRTGGGISLNMRQEHTPPIFAEDRKPGLLQKPDVGD
jgi:hypothetical protein